MKRYLTVDGLGGYIVAMGGLVATAVFLWALAINTQQNEAENFYSIDQDLHSLKANGKNQDKYYKLEGK